MQATHDIHIKEYMPLISPNQLKEELPPSEPATQTVETGRQAIQRILNKEDRRLLVVLGPCSIHDERAALDYARRVRSLSAEVNESFLLVMRVYFEKPQTTIGWKGMISDPCLDGSCDMNHGLRLARRLLLEITEMGVPTATEMLDPITPQYIAELVCWSAIGARTTESQTHREMASGLSMPVGFKNCTDGGLDTAINAMIAAGSEQSFLGIDANGQTCVVRTTGNPHTHIVLRGGHRPNYDLVSIAEARALLRKKGLPETVMVDCSHANCNKNYQLQAMVWQDVINQRLDGNDAIIGLMIESNLHEGQQKHGGDLSRLSYGVSITDPCISWEITERLILGAHDKLRRQTHASPGTESTEVAERYRAA